ncbi:MAG: hypothetical protein OXH31_01725 [Gammaproteobacteria bacterium]|nr:hypothetical protein [Gammaproteobacteria bacterium]
MYAGNPDGAFDSENSRDQRYKSDAVALFQGCDVSAEQVSAELDILKLPQFDGQYILGFAVESCSIANLRIGNMRRMQK